MNMENSVQIEEWIEAIESSNLPVKEQEKRIATLVDLWKFASCHTEVLKIGDSPNLFLNYKNEASEIINVQCSNLIVDADNNITKKIFSEIESELDFESKKYDGIYRFKMKKSYINFNPETIQEIKREIIAAIKGEVILYQYVLKMNRIPAEYVKIVASGFKILAPSNNQISKEITKLNRKPIATSAKKWLVFFLDVFDNKCDYFSFDKELMANNLALQFDKIFLFDYHKGQVIEV